MSEKLKVNPIACTGHGVCAELLPELIEMDPWGYPIVLSDDLTDQVLSHVRRAVTSCPTLALIIERTRD